MAPLECLETQINAKRDVHKQNRDKAIASAATLRVTIPKSRQCAMDLAQERGASSWLTILPLGEFGLTLHKGAFRDAIALRYGWQPALIPSTCACGTSFSVEHALSSPMGGFPIVRHNEVRDLTAKLMSEVYHDVCIEPTLQPITGDALSGASAITEDGARLDVAANGFWGGHFDVKQTTSFLLPPKTRKHQETGLRTESSGSRARLLHSPRHVPYTVGLGSAATTCYKRLASLCSLPNGNSPTAVPWPGSVAACHSLFFAHQSSA